jgi:hypothetical protein
MRKSKVREVKCLPKDAQLINVGVRFHTQADLPEVYTINYSLQRLIIENSRSHMKSKEN